MQNLSLQGREVTLCELIAKITVFFTKLWQCRGNISSDTLSMFSTVPEFLHQSPQLKTENFTKLITKHLVKLEEEINGIFQILVRITCAS